jgi:hypothetical protein
LWLSDIARQISAGLRCDSKKLKALQKSHRAPQKSARMMPWQTSSADGVAEKYFRHACARRSRKFSFSPSPSFFALATGESALTRPKKHRAEHRVPPTIERYLLPVTPDASGIRS